MRRTDPFGPGDAVEVGEETGTVIGVDEVRDEYLILWADGQTATMSFERAREVAVDA